jgi:hypothetical protein
MKYSKTTENRIGTQNIGNVLSQLLLCKQINPDFHAEELNSITKDSKEIAKILADMQEYLPKQEAYMGELTSWENYLKCWNKAHCWIIEADSSRIIESDSSRIIESDSSRIKESDSSRIKESDSSRIIESFPVSLLFL